jgi:hypothetical protein
MGWCYFFAGSGNLRSRADDWEIRCGNTINYPGNPRFRIRVSFKVAPTSKEMEDKTQMLSKFALVTKEVGVRNRTLILIEREDDTSTWRNFLVYFSHSTIMSCPSRSWRYIFIGC